jgi:hypothetical protein
MPEEIKSPPVYRKRITGVVMHKARSAFAESIDSFTKARAADAGGLPASGG